MKLAWVLDLWFQNEDLKQKNVISECADLQNSSVNNTATEQISHQHQQKSSAKPGFIAANGDTSAQDSCSGIAKPIFNIK